MREGHALRMAAHTGLCELGRIHGYGSQLVEIEQTGVLLLIASTAISSMVVSSVLLLRRQDQTRRDTARLVYRIAFPRDLTYDQAVAFVRGLVGLRGPRWTLLGRMSMALEVVATPGSIEHRLRVPQEAADQVLAQLRSTIPGARATPVAEPAHIAVDVAREIRLSQPLVPIRTDQAAMFAASLLHSLQPLGASELVVMQLVVYPVGSPTMVPTSQQAAPRAGPTWLTFGLRAVAPGSKTHQADRRAIRAKATEPWFAAVMRVGARSGSSGRARHLVRRVTGVMVQLDNPPHVRLRPLAMRSTRQARVRLARAATPILPTPVHLNAREVATAAGFPVGGPAGVPGLSTGGSRLLPPVRELPSKGLVVGRAIYPGLERDIAITAGDALMHVLVAGPTGSGKSTLLLNLITQRMNMGQAVIVVDPNGDLAEDVIDRIPAERVADLIWINPLPGEPAVVGLNPLACSPQDAEVVADRVLAVIRQGADSWGPRLEELLRACLVALAATGMTLIEVPSLLLDRSFAARIVGGLGPALAPVAEVFARFESWSEGERAQAVSAVLNKITPLTGRSVTRAMLGQARPSWTMSEVMSQSKILVLSLPSGVIGPVAADLIGGLTVNLAWNAAMARQIQQREARRPVTLVIDELPRFVRGSTNLADMLARARGHGLGLIGAVQHMAQVRPALGAAILSEARNKVIFQTAAADAALFARHLPGVRPEDLMTLEPRTALASLVASGQVRPPATIATSPPPPVTGYGRAAREASRATYAEERTDIERAIAERRGGAEPGPQRTRRIEE